jgi:hypothetical protein
MSGYTVEFDATRAVLDHLTSRGVGSDSNFAPAAREYDAAPAEGLPMLDSPPLADFCTSGADRVLCSSGTRDDDRLRIWLIAAAVAGACSVAWLVTYGLPSGSVPSPAAESKGAASPQAETRKQDRLPIRSEAVREPERAPAARKSKGWTGSRSIARHEAAPPDLRASQRTTAEAEPRVTTPVPETKPTTVEGWMLRDVSDGVAVLEGPQGTWRVRSGETVPELGRVNSIVRWGNRWIVATSKGLVSTP